MENSPYLPPKADLERASKPGRSLWWKVYFFVITIITALGFVGLMITPGAGAVEIISSILWILATIGLFGFCFMKAVFKPSFWLALLILYLGFNVSYYYITEIDLRAGMTDKEFLASSAIGWLISLPGYFALYALTKSSDPAWRSA